LLAAANFPKAAEFPCTGIAGAAVRFLRNWRTKRKQTKVPRLEELEPPPDRPGRKTFRRVTAATSDQQLVQVRAEADPIWRRTGARCPPRNRATAEAYVHQLLLEILPAARD